LLHDESFYYFLYLIYNPRKSGMEIADPKYVVTQRCKRNIGI